MGHVQDTTNATTSDRPEKAHLKWVAYGKMERMLGQELTQEDKKVGKEKRENVRIITVFGLEDSYLSHLAVSVGVRE